MIMVRAPLRISFGGGGTDLAAYYEQFGGFVVSTSISRYAYVVVRQPVSGGIHLNSADFQVNQSFRGRLPSVREPLMLPKAVLEWFGQRGSLRNGVELFMASEVPPGTGLGSSSSITVALIQALAAYTGEELSDEEIAELACRIEIERLGMPIGKQDQYAAALGGLNMIRFSTEAVKASPLPLAPQTSQALEMRLMLFSTGQTHDSSAILEKQQSDSREDMLVIGRLHRLKELGEEMCEQLKLGDLDEFGRLLDESWQFKRQLSGNISNPDIDRWYQEARAAGAIGGKISGAGGGGYLLLYCPPRRQRAVRERLSGMGLRELSFAFDREGVKLLRPPTGQPQARPARMRVQQPKETTTPMEKNDIEQYWYRLSAMTQAMPLQGLQEAVGMLSDCQKRGSTVFVVGNGGSAATASHFACDLAKGTRSSDRPTFRVMPLTDSSPVMTAWANDTSYERVFAEQLEAFVEKGDVVIAISTSGNSPNVVAAAEVAQDHGAMVIALTGPERNALQQLAQLHIPVPPGSIEQIEDLHLVIAHSLTVALRNRLASKSNGSGPSVPVRANGSGR